MQDALARPVSMYIAVKLVLMYHIILEDFVNMIFNALYVYLWPISYSNKPCADCFWLFSSISQMDQESGPLNMKPEGQEMIMWTKLGRIEKYYVVFVICDINFAEVW